MIGAKFLLPLREKKPQVEKQWGQGAPRARGKPRGPSAWRGVRGGFPDVLEPSVVSDAAGRSLSRDNWTAGTVPEYQS